MSLPSVNLFGEVTGSKGAGRRKRHLHKARASASLPVPVPSPLGYCQEAEPQKAWKNTATGMYDLLIILI